MSTRSRIGVEQKDGSIVSVYCHFDGYPSGVGSTLLQCYNTYDKANEVVALGDLSSLNVNLYPLPEAELEFWYPKQEGDKCPIITSHSFEQQQKGVTVAYCRDRKETFTQMKDKAFSDFIPNKEGKNNWGFPWEEWGYLFKDGKWLVWKVGVSTEWVSLERYIEKDDSEDIED